MAKPVQHKPGIVEFVIMGAILVAGILAAGIVLLFFMWGWEGLGGSPSFGALLQYFTLMYGMGLATFGLAVGIVAAITTERAKSVAVGVLCFGAGGVCAGIAATVLTRASRLSGGDSLCGARSRRCRRRGGVSVFHREAVRRGMRRKPPEGGIEGLFQWVD